MKAELEVIQFMDKLDNTYTDIIACDFSMRRPGFAVLRFYPTGKKVAL